MTSFLKQAYFQGCGKGPICTSLIYFFRSFYDLSSLRVKKMTPIEKYLFLNLSQIDAFLIEIVGNVSKHLDVLLNFWAKIFSGQLRGSSGKRLLSKQMGESAAQVAQKNGQNIYSMATAHKRWRNRKCAKSTPAQGHAHLYIV